MYRGEWALYVGVYIFLLFVQDFLYMHYMFTEYNCAYFYVHADVNQLQERLVHVASFTLPHTTI